MLAVTRVQLILLNNLIDRMEYNEKQNQWKLNGPITLEEKRAIITAKDALSQYTAEKEE